MSTITHATKYGKITLYSNECYIGEKFKEGTYWDEDTLLKLKEYIDPNRNILEIGGHCGTSSIVYASFLNDSKKVYVYEPQKKLYELLVQNINQNSLQDKIIPFCKGVFCYNGTAHMNDIDIDGGGGCIEKRYTEESNLPCNFGGVTLGTQGESIELTTIDSMGLSDIGYIHCDSQGSENFIFSSAETLLSECKPVILYENNEKYHDGRYLYENVCKNYPEYVNESKYSIMDYCINTLKYSRYIPKFNDSLDDLLDP